MACVVSRGTLTTVRCLSTRACYDFLHISRTIIRSQGGNRHRAAARTAASIPHMPLVPIRNREGAPPPPARMDRQASSASHKPHSSRGVHKEEPAPTQFPVRQWVADMLGTIPSALEPLVAADTFSSAFRAARALRTSYPFAIAVPLRIARFEDSEDQQLRYYDQLLNTDMLYVAAACIKRVKAESSRGGSLSLPPFIQHGMIWCLNECCYLLHSRGRAPRRLCTQAEVLLAEIVDALASVELGGLHMNRAASMYSNWINALQASAMPVGKEFLIKLLKHFDCSDASKLATLSNASLGRLVLAFGGTKGLSSLVDVTQHFRAVSVELLAQTVIQRLSIHPAVGGDNSKILEWVPNALFGFAGLKLSPSHPVWEAGLTFCVSHATTGGMAYAKSLQQLRHILQKPEYPPHLLHLLDDAASRYWESSESIDVASASALVATGSSRVLQDIRVWRSVISVAQSALASWSLMDPGHQLMQLHSLLRNHADVLLSMERSGIQHCGLFLQTKTFLEKATVVLEAHPLPEQERATLMANLLLGLVACWKDPAIFTDLIASVRKSPMLLHFVSGETLVRIAAYLAYHSALDDSFMKSIAHALDQRLKELPLKCVGTLLDAILVGDLAHKGKPAHVARFCFRTLDQVHSNGTMPAEDILSGSHYETLLLWDIILSQGHTSPIRLHSCFSGIRLSATSARLSAERVAEYAAKVRPLIAPCVHQLRVVQGLPALDAVQPCHVTEHGLILDFAWPAERVCVQLLDHSSYQQKPAADVDLEAANKILSPSGTLRHSVRRLLLRSPMLSAPVAADTAVVGAKLSPFVELRCKLLASLGWKVIQVPLVRTTSTR